jgi:FkbM family methyltransferase
MKLIFDIGAHSGMDTEFYLKKGFKVVAVEANPYVADKLENKLGSYIKSGQLIMVRKAISEYFGMRLNLHIHKNHDDWGTLCNNWNKIFDDDIESISVKTIEIRDLIEKYGVPYYMKIDIEGKDATCIRGLSDSIYPFPEFISAELLTYNNILGENVDCLGVIHALIELGYKKFQLVDQGKNHLTKCPYPALEGNYVDYKFDGYCSGLFGKELPDKWVGIKEIMLQYIHYFYRKPNCAGESLDDGSWFDIHAKL